MDKVILQQIKDKQAAYFEEKIGEEEKQRGQYNQILKSEGLGYRVDVYDGPKGKGYIIREEKEELNKTYTKSQHFGVEKYRDEKNDEWVEEKNT